MEAQKEGDKKTVKTPTQQTEHLSEIETLLDAVSTYEPLVPPQVVRSYLKQTGVAFPSASGNLQESQSTLLRLVGLTAQSLVSDVISDARKRAQLTQPTTQTQADGNVLKAKEVIESLEERGISFYKSDYF